MTEQIDFEKRIWRALFPETHRRVERIRENRTRFVHYTSAESGIAILRSNRMLLRNSTLLNDFSEVRHGMSCLSYAWQSPAGERLKALMRHAQENLPEVFEPNFNETFSNVVKGETYLISLSEHGDPVDGDEFEDAFGRLSMWRAYGSQCGVAFVFNNDAIVSGSNALNAFTSPVVYATPHSFLAYFEEMVNGLEANIGAVADRGGVWLHDHLEAVFRFAVQSTKHPSFKEEREWRVIYTPTLLETDVQPLGRQLPRIPTEIMTLRGVPQRVYAIPFQSYPEDGFVGATLPELINRVLIGPSPDANAIRQAFVAELVACGVPDADEKVVVTGIPLRV